MREVLVFDTMMWLAFLSFLKNIFEKIEIFIPLIFESVNEKRNKLLLGISMNVSQGNLIEIKIHSNKNSTN